MTGTECVRPYIGTGIAVIIIGETIACSRGNMRGIACDFIFWIRVSMAGITT